MQKVILSILINIFLISIGHSQISGLVYDRETGQPLEGANVYLKITKAGQSTDRDGYFTIEVNPDNNLNDTLVVSFLGYKIYKICIADFENNRKILLTPSLLQSDKIEVLAQRLDLAQQELPHLRETINLEQLQRYGSSEIGDVFKRMPAVRMEGNDLDGRHVQVRGSNASEVKVYYDGILLNNLSFDNSADLSIIPVEAIKKLEVLKGSNLPLLGNGAFGGVINIQSEQKLETAVRFKAKLGSFDTRYYLGSLAVPVTGKLFVNYFGQYNEMNPEIEYFPDERFSDKSTNSSIEVKKQNHTLNLDYLYQTGQLRAKIITYAFDYSKPGWRNKRDNYISALTFSNKSGYNIMFSMTNSQDVIDRDISVRERIRNDYKTKNFNFQLAKKIMFTGSSLQLLAEYFHDDLERASKLEDRDLTRIYNQARAYDNRAGVSAVYSFEDRSQEIDSLSWKTFIGVREDFSASRNQAFTNSLGLELSYTRQNWSWRPYMNYGKNVKYPSLLESAYAGDLIDFNGTDTSFSVLEPEYNQSFEFGLNLSRPIGKYILDKMDFSLAYFHNTIYNKILMRPMGDLIVQTQIGRNTSEGVEGSAKFEKVFRLLDLTLSYLKLNISNPLLYEYKPEQSAAIQADFYASRGFYFNAVYFYEGKSYAWYFDTDDELRTQRLDPHFDMDVSMGYRFRVGRIESNLQVAGYNVFDNAGYRYYYLKKRYLQASLSVSY